MNTASIQNTSTNTAVYSFDARGIAKRFRHAAIFGALESLNEGETGFEVLLHETGHALR